MNFNYNRATSVAPSQRIRTLLKQGDYQQTVAFIVKDMPPQGCFSPLLPILETIFGRVLELTRCRKLKPTQHNYKSCCRNWPNLLAMLTIAYTDTCHLFGLSGSAAARTHVEGCLNDAYEEVREIAEETTEELEKQNAKTQCEFLIEVAAKQ